MATRKSPAAGERARPRERATAQPPLAAEHPAGATLRAWYVYLLECVDGSVYTGIAIDVAARYAQHVAGTGARYTRARPPRRVLATFACDGRSSATRLEVAIKRLDAARKRELVTLQIDGTTLLARLARHPASCSAEPVRRRRHIESAS